VGTKGSHSASPLTYKGCDIASPSVRSVRMGAQDAPAGLRTLFSTRKEPSSPTGGIETETLGCPRCGWQGIGDGSVTWLMLGPFATNMINPLHSDHPLLRRRAVFFSTMLCPSAFFHSWKAKLQRSHVLTQWVRTFSWDALSAKSFSEGVFSSMKIQSVRTYNTYYDKVFPIFFMFHKM
jgi:hypothetical protein